MAGTTVLLAGAGGGASAWASRLADAGLIPRGVWSPSGTGEADAAERLAHSLDIPLDTGEEVPVGADAVIGCLRGERRAQLLASVPDGTPVLVDGLTLDSTDVLEQQLGGASARLLSGHHLAAHPSFTRAAAAVRDGEIGLLRAVMVDLVVAAGDGPGAAGDVRGIGADAADLVSRLTGPARTTIATASLAVDHVTFLGQTDRDVVLSVHASRTSSGEGTVFAGVRIVGSHGHVSVDLTRPALTVRTPHGTRAVSYGADSRTARLRELRVLASGTGRGESAASWLAVSRLLDAVAESSERRVSVTVEKQI